ncbi:SGNH/GDSL hydrolase family protein [Gracilimonas sp.]|uniref:SGNH/GDSL hydrolase family protein n=1 Tax=Gracilimonas sp. TaxID=1974203 RepID=UPI0032ECA038
MKSFLKTLSINAVLLVILFGIIELSVRIFIPQIQPPTTDDKLIKENVYGSTFGLKPNVKARSMGHYFETDSLGFWKYPRNNESSAGWLLLGDSVTMGMGVDQDSTYAGQLAFAFDSLHIINPSLLGYASDDYANIFSRLSGNESLNINRVTLFWCLNDIYSKNIAVEGPKGLRGMGQFLSNFIYNHIYTYQWLKKIIFDRPKTYFLYDKQFYSSENEQFENAIRNLIEIKNTADSLDIRFDVIIMPYEYQFRSNDTSPQNHLMEALSEKNIRFLSLFEILNTNSNSSENLYLYGDGIHYSKLGHRMVFEQLKSYYNEN